MSSIGVRATLSGSGVKGLRGLNTRIRNAKKKTIEGFAKWHVQDTRRRIAVTKTDPHGRHWAPWKFSTFQSRRQRGTLSGGLLFESGALWRSIKYTIRGNKMQMGSTADYAKYLQNGRPGMQPRQIVNLNTRRSKIVFRKLFKRNIR